MAGYFKGSTTHDAVGYKCGEDIEFRLELSDGARRFGCPLFKWEMYGDDGAKSSGMAPGESGTIELHTTLAKPGFVHVIVTAARSTAHRCRLSINSRAEPEPRSTKSNREPRPRRLRRILEKSAHTAG